MKNIRSTLLLFLVFSFGLGVGYVATKKQIFPYAFLESGYAFARDLKNGDSVEYGPWSIGIYEGESPFKLSPSSKVENPVLTAQDVTDVEGQFVADPFLLQNHNKHYMFFEVLNRESGHGDIAYAESNDGYTWSYKEIIIDERFHLSYPQVFEWNNEFYLIPESYDDLSVRLYKAKRFPDKWEYLGNILSGYQFIDPTVYRNDNKWWLFVSTPSNENLNLYFSENLEKNWSPHPMNPIVRKNKNKARPAGRILEYEGSIYRITQDDYPDYGTQVYSFKITELSEKSYLEVEENDQPILLGSGHGWNGSGMHHLDVIKEGQGKWKAVVDGRDR